MTRMLGALAVSVSLLLGSAANASGPEPVTVQILAVNDFHGNLEPPAGASGRIGNVDAGGVEYLATHIAALRATNPNTVFVSAGDLIGASPLLSGLFHDEPTIEAFNLMRLDFNAVGNHEFDEGASELLRMKNGGCHPVDGCQDGDGFAGANFQLLAANVVREPSGKTLFPAYKVRNFGSVKLAFIGVTLASTPSVVTPTGIAGLGFRDEVDTVNALVRALLAKGVRAIVVLIHEGGLPTGNYDECPGISGRIVDIANRLDDEVDAIISGHTHQAYNCVIDGKRVTSAASYGRLVTDIDMRLDRASGEVLALSSHNLTVSRDVAADAAQSALLEKYRKLSAPLANRVIGRITASITRGLNAAGESSLGDVIADAQRFAAADPEHGGAVIAFMNSGGMRTDLTHEASGTEGDGIVTHAEAFAVHPFRNTLVIQTMTGAQIQALLEQQFDNPSVGERRILQVSDGLSYTWSESAPIGHKISRLTLRGHVVEPGARYRVTMNSYLADGGDNFPVFKQGTDRLGGKLDLDALEAYFRSAGTVSPGRRDRITRVP